MSDQQAWVAILAVITAVVGALGVGLRAVISGALVPRAQVDAMTAQWTTRLAESAERERDWRDAYRAAEETGDTRDAILAKLMTYAETSDRVLADLSRRVKD